MTEETGKSGEHLTEGVEMFGSEAVAGAGDSQMSARTHAFGEVVRDIHLLNEETRLQSVAEMMKSSPYQFVYSPFVVAAGAGIFAGTALGVLLVVFFL